MLNANTVHNEVYDLLTKCRQNDLSFHFTLRKSNREGRLSKGYWFYGNEYYLAVSFWTGMDWKNKTPNIIFVILFESGETYLEINTSDSDEKRRFINQYLVDALALEAIGKRYRKSYEGTYIQSLENFITGDKVVIDNVLSAYAQSFFEVIDNGIYFIDDIDFENQNEKINQYRDENIVPQGTVAKPVKINEIIIENFGPIRDVRITDIPFSSQWIFFTGENGTGKTSILRSITTAVCGRKSTLNDLDYRNAVVHLRLFLNNEEILSHQHHAATSESNYPLMAGFAAYGQSRLKTDHSGLSSDILRSISTDDLTSSIFDEESYLIDLQRQFDIWRNNNLLRNRKEYIKEILIDILPNLYDINFDDIIGDIPATTYIEKDHEGAEFRKVTFKRLASGLKSMISMIGDILVRLYEQQTNINDPSEFTGIVLIDEIDIHLHPKLQRQIVQQLTKTFPKVQFIASTHSPIPFLGAPKNSQIFKVERTSADGVKIKRLDELLELGDLLPNTILTSPIFGLEDIIPESHDQKKIIRTELTYSDIDFNDRVLEKISSFLTDEKEQQLINLFKSRRQ